jgi:hypothetical protein
VTRRTLHRSRLPGVALAAVLALAAHAPRLGAQVAGTAAADSAKREAVLQHLDPRLFGVPGSPAFELLPSQPTEVPTVVTPADFQTNLRSWVQDGKLKAGAAFDSRPFVSSVGDLDSYRGWRAALFRTVMSAGSATSLQGERDVLLAAGVRVPLVDRGDPREDTAYQARLARAYDGALVRQGPPPFTATAADLQRRSVKASAALDTVRSNFAAAHWNALKVDLGVAASGVVAGGKLTLDSAQSRRGGLWASFSGPLPRQGGFAQWTVSGKALWAQADSAASEREHYSAGGRIKAFASDRFDLQAEAAQVWTSHADASLNDRWTHLGIVAEWFVPELRGWLAAGYGGDRGRKGGKAGGLTLNYAFYRQRVVTR